MQKSTGLIALSILALSQVQAADAPSSRRPLTPDDFYNLQVVSDPQVSPDGKWVAYVVSADDREADESRSALWMASWDGTQQVQLTNPGHDINSPRWSRDGRYLSYLNTPAGADKSQVMLFDRRGGEARALTNVTDDIQGYEWSPDSKRIVLVMEPGAPKAPPAAGGESAQPNGAAPGAGPATSPGAAPDTTKQTPDPGKAAPPPASGSKGDAPPKPIVIDSLHFKEDKEGYLGTGHNRHLYLLDVDTQAVQPLTNAAGLNEDLPAWSPDSRRIAFVQSHEKGMDPDGMTDLDVIDVPPPAASGTRSASTSPAAWPSPKIPPSYSQSPTTGPSALNPQLPTPAPAHAGKPAPTPAAPPAPAPLLSTHPTKLLRIYAPNQQKLTWSPDGATLAFLQGVEPKYGQYGQDRLAITKVNAGATAQVLTESLDRAISSYVFNKDSTTITATIFDDTTSYPITINTRTRAIKKMSQGLAVVSDLNASAGHVVALSSNDTSATEIYALEGEHLRKLTKHTDAFVAQLKIGAVHDLQFKSADGTPIHGLVVEPPDFQPGRKYPTILYIHGGPNLQDEHSFAYDGYQFKRQMLAAGGFVVLGVNYRGSSGKGDAFSRAIAADWGHKEVEDLMAGVDAVIQEGIADPTRLGIGGWSYGGMLTDYTIGSNTRFKAAVSGAGTANPLGLYAVDQYYIQYNKELGDPWRNPDLYVKLAYPLLHADRIRTPTLFMGGDKDFNVPIAGGEQMYLALRTLGVPTQLIVYPGQYHTLTRPSFLQDRVERMAAWYTHYLISSAP
ncbi:MAG: S9 family peptidase [Proteobacteria bacterium]|nr:S9 family peptidase [Pseudomonadota bacterium]